MSKPLTDRQVTRHAEDMVRIKAISYLVKQKLVESHSEAIELVKNASPANFTLHADGECTVSQVVNICSSQVLVIEGSFTMDKNAYRVPKSITIRSDRKNIIAGAEVGVAPSGDDHHSGT